MAKPAFEPDLISMVTSLRQLRMIGEELRKREFVLPRLKDVMRGADRAFEDLNASFERTEDVLQKEAQPYLEEWLAARGLRIGGTACFEGASSGKVARVRGRLESVRLHPHLCDSKRLVELILEEPEFATDTMSGFAPFESFSREALSPVMRGRIGAERVGVAADGYRNTRSWVADDKADRHVVRVKLPIKKADLDDLVVSLWPFRMV